MKIDKISDHPYSVYYVIYTVVSLGNTTKFFPIVTSTKIEMDNILVLSLKNDKEYLDKIFPNDKNADVKIKPFIALQKTLISHDYIETEAGVSENQPGKILSKIIPVDYVSEIYFRDQVRAKGKTKEIRNIIFQASKGAKVHFKSKKQWLK